MIISKYTVNAHHCKPYHMENVTIRPTHFFSSRRRLKNTKEQRNEQWIFK